MNDYGFKIHFVASNWENVPEKFEELKSLYTHYNIEDANVIVALGGDGFMLRTLHHYQEYKLPIYGMNLGSVGFLMNVFEKENLYARIHKAQTIQLHPLQMKATTTENLVYEALAINEVALRRSSRLAAKIQIDIDGTTKLDELVGDGVLLSTAAGSTAYNLSVNGPIIPISANLLALSPISAFRPRRWKGALLPHKAQVTFHVLQPEKRPVSAETDLSEIANIKKVEIFENRQISIQLLFDKKHNLEERIIAEQFLT